MPFKDKAARAQYDKVYAKENKKRVHFDVSKAYYDDIISNIKDLTGLPVNTFIKQAIAEKIKHDKINLPVDKYPIRGGH